MYTILPEGLDVDNYKERTRLILSVAELGAIKSLVDGLPFTHNRTEQRKAARIIVGVLVQFRRARGNSIPLPHATLISFSTQYNLAEDDLFYTFEIEYSAMRPTLQNIPEAE